MTRQTKIPGFTWANLPLGKDWVDTAEAAGELECTRQWVRMLARRGDLASMRIGNIIRISRPHLDAYKATRAAEGGE